MGKRLHSSLTVIYANESSNLLGLREDTVLFLSVSLTLTKAMAKKKKWALKQDTYVQLGLRHRSLDIR